MDRPHHLGEPVNDVILPPGGRGPGVVVAHAWWGLNATMAEYGRRLAAQGFVVALPDLFDGDLARTNVEAEVIRDKPRNPPAGIRLRRAVSTLASHGSVDGGRVGAVGFSYSGWHLLGMPGKVPELGALVVYYATRAIKVGSFPLMLHLAADDPFESLSDMESLLEQVPEAGYQYPGTRHWFAESDRPEYSVDAAELAFDRTVAFLRRTLR